MIVTFVEGGEVRRDYLILVPARSVSVLAAAGTEPAVRAAVAAAHEAACERALGYLQERLGGSRTRGAACG